MRVVLICRITCVAVYLILFYFILLTATGILLLREGKATPSHTHNCLTQFLLFMGDISHSHSEPFLLSQCSVLSLGLESDIIPGLY